MKAILRLFGPSPLPNIAGSPAGPVPPSAVPFNPNQRKAASIRKGLSKKTDYDLFLSLPAKKRGIKAFAKKNKPVIRDPRDTRISELESDLGSLLNHLEQDRISKADLNSKLSQAQHENTTLKEKVLESEERIAALEKALADQKTERHELYWDSGILKSKGGLRIKVRGQQNAGSFGHQFHRPSSHVLDGHTSVVIINGERLKKDIPDVPPPTEPSRHVVNSGSDRTIRPDIIRAPPIPHADVEETRVKQLHLPAGADPVMNAITLQLLSLGSPQRPPRDPRRDLHKIAVPKKTKKVATASGEASLPRAGPGPATTARLRGFQDENAEGGRHGTARANVGKSMSMRARRQLAILSRPENTATPRSPQSPRTRRTSIFDANFNPVAPSYKGKGKARME